MKINKIFIFILTLLSTEQSILGTDSNNKVDDNYKFKSWAIYTLKSLSIEDGYLDGTDRISTNPLVTVDRNPSGNNRLRWTITHLGNDVYHLRSASNGGYLDGRTKTGDFALVTNGDPSANNYLQWTITRLGNDVYHLRSASSNCYLSYISSGTGYVAIVEDGDPSRSNFLRWEIKQASE